MTAKTILTDEELTSAFRSSNGERKHFEATFNTRTKYAHGDVLETKTLTASDKPTAERLAREYGARFLGGKKVLWVYLVATDPAPKAAPAPVLADAQTVTSVTVYINGSNVEHVHATGCADIEKTLNGRNLAESNGEFSNARAVLEYAFGDVARDQGETGSEGYEESLQGEIGSRLIIKPCVPAHLRNMKAVK